MVDLKTINTKALQERLWAIEPDLMDQVDPQRVDSCLAGACDALHRQPATERKR